VIKTSKYYLKTARAQASAAWRGKEKGKRKVAGEHGEPKLTGGRGALEAMEGIAMCNFPEGPTEGQGRTNREKDENSKTKIGNAEQKSGP